ncbi:hypothetical protein [Escherichia coli]|uniref:hypothetical protein n=1 Tax=Escherichia coli TaxID=562 RepID=UPI0020232860|nr:hypothetical protein [Escherichia coli]
MATSTFHALRRQEPGETYVAVGTVATQKGADAGYALPFAFPYAGLFATGNRGTSGYNAAMNVRIASRTHISIQNWSPSERHRRLLFYRAGVLRMNKFYKGSFYPKALKRYISARFMA